MKRLLNTAIVLVLMSVAAMAGDVSVKATVSHNRVAFGEGLQYTITVIGAQGAAPPSLPDIDGFDVRYSGPATRVSVINNAYSVEQSFNYMLVPLKEGKFVIPSVAVDVKGQSFATDPVVVDVVPMAQAEQPGGSSSSVDQQQAQDIRSRLKLLMALGRDKVYVGEAVPLTLRLYVNQISLQDLAYPEVSQEGFQMEAFGEPRQFEDMLDGVNWHVVEFSTLVYPSRPGELVISPAQVKASLVFKVNDRRGRGEQGGFFDDPFFSNFFSSYQKRPLTITSPSARLDVLSLPEENRPSDFSGAVGRFDLDVEASPLKLKAGDPVTLRMILTGAGNMKSIRMPSFEAEGFKVYDPQIKDEPGRKILEQVIIPTDEKVAQVPAVRFTFFDAQAGVYRTIERGPFSLEIAAPAKGEEFQAVGFAQLLGVSAPEKFGRDIVFVKDSPGVLRPYANSFGAHVFFYIALAVYVQVWAALLVLYFYRRRILNDPRFARQRVAARQALMVFQKAAGHLHPADVRGFYDLLQKGLNDYFIQRLDIPPGHADVRRLEDVLRGLKLEDRCILAVIDIYAAAERVRFAGMAADESGMRAHLADAEDVVKAVERRVR